MQLSRSIWRQAFLLGVVFALGWTASRAAAPGGGGSVLLTVSVLLTAGLAWWSATLWSQTFATLTTYVLRWRNDLAEAMPAGKTLPEADELRSALREVQKSLQAAREQRHERILGLERDTLLLQSVLGTMVEAVAVFDASSRLIYANPAARRVLELGERDSVGRLLHELLRSAALHQLVEQVLTSGEEHRGELELSRKERHVTVSACPLPLSPHPGVVLVMHDVTELRRLEQVRREFASNVSHELKTPLTSIQAYADALLDGGLEDAAINRGFVQRILEQAERLGQLIFDLLNLSRIESAEESLELEAVDLGALVESVLHDHRAVAQSMHLDLRFESPPGPVWVTADREAVRTIVDNLVRNALTYT
ncbi:MAG: PAS domain-containing protein, partial [Planctomycetaceae bacterium]|nr:PAS domain-containing protein [Planctomycetaceae bacterium]